MLQMAEVLKVYSTSLSCFFQWNGVYPSSWKWAILHSLFDMKDITLECAACLHLNINIHWMLRLQRSQSWKKSPTGPKTGIQNNSLSAASCFDAFSVKTQFSLSQGLFLLEMFEHCFELRKRKTDFLLLSCDSFTQSRNQACFDQRDRTLNTTLLNIPSC